MSLLNLFQVDTLSFRVQEESLLRNQSVKLNISLKSTPVTADTCGTAIWCP